MQIPLCPKMVKMIKVFLSSVTSPRRDNLVLVNTVKGTGQKGIKFIFSDRTDKYIFDKYALFFTCFVGS